MWLCALPAARSICCHHVEHITPLKEEGLDGVVVRRGIVASISDDEVRTPGEHDSAVAAKFRLADEPEDQEDCNSELSAGVDSHNGDMMSSMVSMDPGEPEDKKRYKARRSVVPMKITDLAKVADFEDMLNAAGVDTSSWTTGEKARSVDRLYWEATQQLRCHLASADETGQLKRVVRLVKIKLLADIFGVEHALFSRLQISPDGRTNERKQLPLRRLAWKHADARYSADDPKLYQNNCPYTEDWVHGCKRALRDRLGLSYAWQEKYLEEDVHSHTFRIEDNTFSPTYPGLRTLYAVHEVVFRVADTENEGVRCIGLPSGQEFATTEGNFDVTYEGGEVEHIGTQLNIWTWERSAPSSAGTGSSPRRSGMAHPIKRVPIPSLSGKVLSGYRAKSRSRSIECRPPSVALRVAQEGRLTDWEKVQRMSESIADPEYSLDKFYADLSAFPELDLYLLDGDVVPQIFKGVAGSPAASSGRTIGDEYQRTVGAFFAIYWLLRLRVDGREGFCFGVDEAYRPIRPDAGEDRMYPAEKRLKFFKESLWDKFEGLLLDAELLIKERGGKIRINSKRVATALALTAIHDIMKVQSLLPTVAPMHPEYHGYVAGDVINDHDHALSYVMDHYPDLLPSFCGLPPEEKASVQFTQCELCFNHGWLVQAEAPPGAVFTKFREVLSRGRRAKAPAKDIALYFVHWLTDLAGAEPTPLGGCEKFVIKFPLPVLNSFLRSFKAVQRIASETETQVMEKYLVQRWKENVPSMGNVPTGSDAIAKMRILCMAQMNAPPILQAFGKLPAEDSELLAAEMALTGCSGQSYSAKYVPKGHPLLKCGPAFLVYYGPAFLQSLGSDDPVLRLRILAEIYRNARRLWPAGEAQVSACVTVRIDAIKGLSNGDLRTALETGFKWAMVRKNGSEAFIDRLPVAALEAQGDSVQVLDLTMLMPSEAK